MYGCYTFSMMRHTSSVCSIYIHSVRKNPDSLSVGSLVCSSSLGQRDLEALLHRDLRYYFWDLFEPLSQLGGYRPESSYHHWYHRSLYSFFLMLIAACTTTAFLSCLSTTMILSVWIRKSHRILAQSFSITLGVVAHFYP